MNTTFVLNQLITGENLSSSRARLLLLGMAQGEMPATQMAALLTALRAKGETPDEIVGFIRGMRQKMIPIEGADAIDVCGTGGDGKGTFNISTAVSFVVAGAGVKVAKHGNRRASSMSGSADVLTALGVNINLTSSQAAKILENVGMVFLFAPLYHPAMKSVSLIRKELGIRTIFNLLGPFCNPASVKRQVIGVPNSTIAEGLAAAALKLRYVHLCIVTSNGTDEMLTSHSSTIFEIKGRSLKKFSINPQSLGFPKSFIRDIKGGDAQTNAHIIRAVLDGRRGPCRDVVILNSALALYVAGVVKNVAEGVVLAGESIDHAKAKSRLTCLIKETQSYA